MAEVVLVDDALAWFALAEVLFAEVALAEVTLVEVELLDGVFVLVEFDLFEALDLFEEIEGFAYS